VRILIGLQEAEIADAVRAKFSLVVPVLEATLYSLARDRIERLGGLNSITLHDIAREFREGFGDAGICFEYAVHSAIAENNPLIAPLASEVLNDFCRIVGNASSILFGPEKDGVIPIIEAVQNSLTNDSVLFVGNKGRPPKLKRYIPKIVRAFRRHEERNKLPRSISGIWRADLFLGNSSSEQWVGTSVKINPGQLQAAQGLRLGIYPKSNQADCPRFDEQLNLIRLPLPYDRSFMELFYKAFYLVRAFMKADARVPPEISLPDSEDRFVTRELELRRSFPIIQVVEVLRDMSQPNLVTRNEIQDLQAAAQISEADGLVTEGIATQSLPISITPIPQQN
jgi:hypothetical protein